MRLALWGTYYRNVVQVSDTRSPDWRSTPNRTAKFMSAHTATPLPVHFRAHRRLSGVPAAFLIGLTGLTLVACVRPEGDAKADDRRAGGGTAGETTAGRGVQQSQADPGQTFTAGEDRQKLIASNLELEIPALRGAEVEVTELTSSGISGLDSGTFTVNGRSVPFLVTRDNTRLFILAASKPIDVSRSAEEVATALAAESSKTAREEETRAAALEEATRHLPRRGPSDAPVTIVEFSDFECPYCRRVVPTIDALLARFPDEVRLVYAHLPLDNHPWAMPAAIAGTCAAQQDEDGFWTLHDFYFQSQQTLTPENVIERSREVVATSGIDTALWQACVTEPASAAHREATQIVRASARLGAQFGVRGTPAFFVNGRLLSGAQPLEAFVEAVEASLRADR